jgi:DNA polymerase III subunit epsilon
MSLLERSFIVVDTETTGTDPAEDRVIEIGAVRIEKGSISDRFEQLVDPGIVVPRAITRLTGITTAMVSGQPEIGEALRRFREFAGDTHLVAHNAGFDHRFLALEAARVGEKPFDDPFLCTLRLARRLLPGLPSKGLDALKAFYGLSIQRRHRAMDDADLTGRVLLRLLPHAETAGARDLEGLMSLQSARYRTSGAVTRRLEFLREKRISAAPRVPGVYRFFDRRGKLLYVGKARSLRDRLRQYVVAVEALPSRTRRLMSRVHEVEWETFATELEAMLHESRTIKSEQPPHNQALRTYRRRPFLRLDGRSLSIRTVIRKDGASHFGPLGNARLASILAEILVCCFDCKYTNRRVVRSSLDRERLQHVLRASGWVRLIDVGCGTAENFLSGDMEGVLERLRHAMSGASEALDFESAATIRNWSAELERRAGRPGELAPRVFDRDAVLIAHRPGASLELAALRDGLPVAFSSSIEDLESVIRVAAGVDLHHERGEVDADEAHVVAHWSFLHREHLLAVERQSGESPEHFAGRVMCGLPEEITECGHSKPTGPTETPAAI